MQRENNLKPICFYPPNRECPAYCPGLSIGFFIGERVFEICPNPDMQGAKPTIIEPNDDGPVVVTVYSDSPSVEECIKAIYD